LRGCVAEDALLSIGDRPESRKYETPRSIDFIERDVTQ
jgi:hypothetical protein